METVSEETVSFFFDFEQIWFKVPEGRCSALLFEYVEGMEPDGKNEIERIGRQIGELHNLMELFPYGLINRSKYEYIDAYTSYMREMKFDSSKIRDIEQHDWLMRWRGLRVPSQVLVWKCNSRIPEVR